MQQQWEVCSLDDSLEEESRKTAALHGLLMQLFGTPAPPK
jgi:hypothetical protein